VTYRVANQHNLAKTFTLAVYNGSDVIQSAYTVTKSVASGASDDITTAFTATATNWYTRVTGTAAAEYLIVRRVSEAVIPVLAQNEQLRADPGSTPADFNVEKLDSSGYFLARLDADALPFWLPPGLSLIGFSAEDSANAGYADPRSVLARTLVVSPTIHPRYWT
jgi:hypothetical protein